jgi:hypothetical protein
MYLNFISSFRRHDAVNIFFFASGLCRKSGKRICISLVCVMGGLYLDSCESRKEFISKERDFALFSFPYHHVVFLC